MLGEWAICDVWAAKEEFSDKADFSFKSFS
jgi:hypothetical protein